MNNRHIEAAWNYHNGTKHSYESVRTNRHYLDWENQPLPFKIYSKLAPIPLPEQRALSGMAALEAISLAGTAGDPSKAITIQALADMLFLSAGITRRRSYPGGEILFRAAACTGALYHIDLYLICGDLEDLDAGVYHFSPQDFSLRRLRKGDYRSALIDASGDEPAIAGARVHDRRRPRLSGATPGNTRRAPTGIAIGTTARSWQTFWPLPRRARFRRSSSSASSMRR